MSTRDPSAAESWADRLLKAMDADERSADTQSGATIDDLGPSADRPWELSPGTVPDHVVVAAMIGHPTPADADLILGDPAAFRSLTRHWSVMPPDAELLDSATSNPALGRLLTAAGLAVPAARPTHPAKQRMPPSRRGYRLAAASSESARTAEFSGGRLTTQRLPGGSLSVALEFDGGIAADLRRTQLMAWVTGYDRSRERRVLVILVRSGSGDAASLVGRVEMPAGTALDEVEVSAPIPVSELWSQGSLDFDVVTSSVAWAPYAWKEAWRRTALQVGEAHPFSRAVERGLSLR